MVRDRDAGEPFATFGEAVVTWCPSSLCPAILNTDILTLEASG